MKKFYPRKQLKKRKNNIIKIEISHENQIKENNLKNGCWVSSAWMKYSSEGNNKTNFPSIKFAIDYLNGNNNNSCITNECIISKNNNKQHNSVPDIPMCPSCNFDFLGSIYKNQISLRKSLSPKSIECIIINGKSIEAYLCKNNKYAHYTVIHGIFDFSFSMYSKIYKFLMVSDPLEYGPGVVDYDYFLSNGEYGRKNQLNMQWVKSFI